MIRLLYFLNSLSIYLQQLIFICLLQRNLNQQIIYMLLNISRDIYLYFTFCGYYLNDTLTAVNMVETAHKLFRSDKTSMKYWGRNTYNLTYRHHLPHGICTFIGVQFYFIFESLKTEPGIFFVFNPLLRLQFQLLLDFFQPVHS